MVILDFVEQKIGVRGRAIVRQWPSVGSEGKSWRAEEKGSGFRRFVSLSSD